MTRIPAQPDPRATARVPVVIGHVPRPHPAPGGPIPSDRTRLPGLRTQRRARAAGVRYTFDHLTEIVDRFLELQRVVDYSLYLQDYGGPIGFRLALAHPERVQALVIQNAVAHEQGLSDLWVSRKAFWADRAAHEAAVRANLLSLEATRQRHVGRSPHPERIDPETWEGEYALLTRPGMIDIQLDLFHDYRTNVASYPKWQAYLRDVQPPTLVVWGKHDPSFTVAGAVAYGEDLPEAEVHLLDAGHFALDEAAPQIAELIRSFLAVSVSGARARRREHSPE